MHANLNAPPILAANTLIFHGYELEQIFDEIRTAGFLYVEPALISSYYPEIDDGYFSQKRHARQLRNLISANGLGVRAVAAHMNLGAKTAAGSFQRRMDFCTELEAKYVHTNSARKEDYSVFLSNLDRLLPLAESSGLVITLENPGDGEDNMIGSGEEGAKLVGEINSPHLRLNYDFSNIYSYHKGRLRPEDDYKKALPFIGHLHLKEIGHCGKEWCFVSIGQGITNYSNIFHYLAENKVFLPMSIELPIRFKRGIDFELKYNPNSDIPPLSVIRKVLLESREFILGCYPSTA